MHPQKRRYKVYECANDLGIKIKDECGTASSLGVIETRLSFMARRSF